jgi:predicted metal-dependent phosphoesterase TrpH
VIDLHLHTTASDGSLKPAALVAAAAAAGLTVIAVTDHDTTDGFDEAAAAGATAGVRVLTGIEITAVDRGRDVHVLGYFFDRAHPSLVSFLSSQRADRIRRVTEMLDRLARLGVPIRAEDVLAGRREGQSIGRPRIADALVAAGHAADRNDAFDRWIGAGRPAFVARRGATPEEVVSIVAEAGGIASLAHPGLLKSPDLLPRLAAHGLPAVEARHSDHDPETEARFRAFAREHNLLVTGGSDFHGAEGHRVNALGVVTLPAEDFAALEGRAR